MNKIITIAMIILINTTVCLHAQTEQKTDPVKSNIKNYFGNLFSTLKQAADQTPDKESFREIMKPLVGNIEGMYGATLIGTNFVIKQVYFSKHFLARGFDLKKVKELKDFYKQMQIKPAPQLSEPGRGSIMQPALVAMRYPVIKDKKIINIVSLMIRTESFLEAVGLDKLNTYEIICLGKTAEKEGNLSRNPKVITLKLPSTEWVIKYDKKNSE